MRLLFTQLTLDTLSTFVTLRDQGLRNEPWETLARAELTPEEQRVVAHVSADLRRYQPSLVNEATVFARSIFPLLVLAEVEGVQAMADVAMSAQIGEVELAGTADGAIGRPIAGEIHAPFLVVVEAKRGVESVSPVAQLYGELLAAARLNAKETGASAQRLYGCYTVADNWTFIEMTVDDLNAARPTVTVITSPELNEKVEAATIAKVLKSIVAPHRRLSA
jgi:hypothetical protein